MKFVARNYAEGSLHRVHLRHLQRQPHGASMAMVAAASFLLLVVAVAAFQFIIYLGSSRELRHTVDAAVLNVSKRAVENKVPPGQIFEDCGDSRQLVGLQNINRVWGKAYLINANEDELQKQGWDQQGLGVAHATHNYQAAQTVNDGLYNLLTSQSSANSHFIQMANGKPAKLLPTNGGVVTGGANNWGYAWSYRGEESNLIVDTGALPGGAQPPVIQYGGKGPTYLQGYNPNKANNNTFCFTVFHQGEAPHLISDNAFLQAKASVAGAINPIPNTFKDSGLINNSQIPISATACAVANPMRSYNLAIPHAFMTLGIKNVATWTIQGTTYPQTQYFPGTGTVWNIKSYNIKKPGEGIEDGYASLGNEYKGTLYQAINALANHPEVTVKMLQRIKEFCPFYTMQKLQGLLQATPYARPNTTWYFFPVYTQPDLSDPKVSVTTDPNSLPNWLIGHAAGPEGKAVQISTENSANGPNYCWSNIRNGPYRTDKHFTNETGVITWQAGTGAYDGTNYYSLGNIDIQRTTAITFTALP